MKPVLAVDIGGTKTSCALVDESGVIRNRRQVATGRDAAAVLDGVVRLARAVDPSSRAMGLGISTCGVVDPHSGRITGSTDRIAGWLGTDLTGVIQRDLGIPTTSLNDVQAHALGEMVAGAAAGAQTALVVAIGTGVGAALVSPYGVERGSRGAAGHLGHTYSAAAAGVDCPCGKSAHLESIASGLGVPQLYGMLSGVASDLTAEEVIGLAANDVIARRTIDLASSELGRAIGSACNQTDPEVVVLSGGLRNPSPEWSDSLERAMRSVLLPILQDIPLLLAGLGDDAALIGAAHLMQGDNVAVA